MFLGPAFDRTRFHAPWSVADNVYGQGVAKAAATVVNLVTDRCPDQLRLPFALWTREAVGQLMAKRFEVHVSVWTVGRYLKAWGLTPQKPLRRAYEQNPEAVRRWLDKEYPAIRRGAKA